MWKRLTRRDSIAGIAAIFISSASFIAQYNLEGWTMQLEQWLSPLGITFIVLFVLGVSLIIWNYFRRDISFDQKRKTAEDRETYLPELRETIDKMLALKEKIAIQAGRIPLEEYYEKYLSLNDSYAKAFNKLENKNEDVKRKIAIIVALKNQNFHKYNPSFTEFIRSHNVLSEHNNLCESYLSRCGDRNLKREYEKLFKTANKYHLVLAMAEMGLSNDFHLKASKYYENLYEKPKMLKPFIDFYRKRVNKVIDSLMRGDDL